MTNASVFSGIGGPEVPATILGLENLFHCEISGGLFPDQAIDTKKFLKEYFGIEL